MTAFSLIHQALQAIATHLMARGQIDKKRIKERKYKKGSKQMRMHTSHDPYSHANPPIVLINVPISLPH
jgi:hypothetical protein